jgi:hypothetical protein
VNSGPLPASTWKGEGDPLTYSVFCELLDNQPLFPSEEDAQEFDRVFSAHTFLDAGRPYPELDILGGGHPRDVARLVAYLAYSLLQLAEDPAAYIARVAGISLAPGTPIALMYVETNNVRGEDTFQSLRQYLRANLFTAHFWKVGQATPTHITFRFRDIPLTIEGISDARVRLEGMNVLACVMPEISEGAESRPNFEDMKEQFRRNSVSRFRSMSLGVFMHFPGTVEEPR